jgi:thiol-disulfide isomerase/thioredoxin
MHRKLLLIKKKLLAAAAAVLLAGTAHAQALQLHVAEASMREHASIVVDLNLQALEFDAKGRATFQGDTLTQPTRAYVTTGAANFYALLEPGKTLRVEVKGRGKTATLKFEGDNAFQSELTSAVEGFLPPKDVAYERVNPSDTLSFPDAWRLLEHKHAELQRLLAQERDTALRAQLSEQVRLRYLANRITMQSGFCTVRGIDAKHDARLASFMAEVDPNDARYLEHDILQSYLFWKMPVEVSSDMDINVYAQEYLRAIVDNVQNDTLRHLLIDNHVSQVLGAEEVDIDAFWALVRQTGDTDVVRTYQYVVDARRSTQSGMACPDVTFSDLQGEPHRLSEHFGRVLYIDLWATWCGPCVMEIPYLAKLAAHYQDDDRIRFLSISLDQNIEAWEQKVTEDRPAWPQYHVNRDEEKLLSSQWGVRSIPRFLIINADGTINNADAFRPSGDDFIARMDAILDAQR